MEWFLWLNLSDVCQFQWALFFFFLLFFFARLINLLMGLKIVLILFLQNQCNIKTVECEQWIWHEVKSMICARAVGNKYRKKTKSAVSLFILMFFFSCSHHYQISYRKIINYLFNSGVATQYWFVMLNIQAVGGGSEISLFSRMLTQALSRTALHRNSKNLHIYLTSKNTYILPHIPYMTLYFSLCLNFLQLEDSLYRGILHFVPSEDKEKVSQKGMKIERIQARGKEKIILES